MSSLCLGTMLFLVISRSCSDATEESEKQWVVLPIWAVHRQIMVILSMWPVLTVGRTLLCHFVFFTLLFAESCHFFWEFSMLDCLKPGLTRYMQRTGRCSSKINDLKEVLKDTVLMRCDITPQGKSVVFQSPLPHARWNLKLFNKCEILFHPEKSCIS